MRDEYYLQRARRRNRLLWLLGGVAVLVLLAYLGVRALFYDSCTQSFDRDPVTVVRTYAEAIRRGDQPAAQRCWEHEAYYDLAAGCSEICLSKVLGAGYEVGAIEVGEPTTTAEGRANRLVTISVTCDQDGKTHTGEILLDSVSGELPWKHWAIVRSEFGGTVADPWCK